MDKGVWTGYVAGLAGLAVCLAWLAGWTLEKDRLVKKRVVEWFRLRSHEATLAQTGVQKLCGEKSTTFPVLRRTSVTKANAIPK